MEYDGEGQSIPEVNRDRTELNALRLDTPTNGALHNNSFKERMRRLDELNKFNTESAYIDEYIKNIDYLDYESLKEILKSSKCNSL